MVVVLTFILFSPSHFKRWNRDALIQAYTDNPEKVCADAGVASGKLERLPSTPTNRFCCLVCLDSHEEAHAFALGCGHRYCLPCWKQYLELKINSGPDCIFTKCMNPTCSEIVHEGAVTKLVSPDKAQLYKRYLVRSFVADNPLVGFFFPSPVSLLLCRIMVI
jgi:ariadne-1